MTEPQCYFFAALPCEAKPLIHYYKLKKELACTAFTIYRNADITLTVTGIGQSAMAAGVAYTLALYPAARLAILLNIGIAGHRYFELGTVFALEKITHQETGRSYYPQLVSSPPCATHPLITVARPQSDYPSDALYEMEAVAYYETAIRFSSSELIQCIKIISDNTDHPATDIKPAQVSQWITDALPVIEAYRQQLSQLAVLDKPFEITPYTDIIAQWRFSSQEKLQLKSLLNKRAILIQHTPLNLSDFSSASGKTVLKYLREEIGAQAFGGFNSSSEV